MYLPDRQKKWVGSREGWDGGGDCGVGGEMEMAHMFFRLHSQNIIVIISDVALCLMFSF